MFTTIDFGKWAVHSVLSTADTIASLSMLEGWRQLRDEPEY